MKAFKEYIIPFVGLKQGVHQFEFKVDNKFLALFEFEEYNSTNVNVVLDFNKKSTFFELTFKIKGFVNVDCDVTTEAFDLDIENELNLVVKFADEFNDENEEILYLPHGEYEINISQYIYECIVLAVPSKRVHPGVEDGTLDSDILDHLEDLAPKQNEEINEEDIDPRWNKLKNLLKDK